MTDTQQTPNDRLQDHGLQFPLPNLQGRDPRVNLAPSAAIALIQTQFGVGSASGTGWFISPRVLITAGHVLARSATDRATQVVIKPGYNGIDPPPFGPFSTASYAFAPGWDFQGGTEFDYAAIEIESDFTHSLSFVVLSDTELANATLEVAGYPTNFGVPGQLAGDTGTIISVPGVSADPRMLTYNISTSDGQSGSPVFTDPGAKVVGIHVSDGVPRISNMGIRITNDVFNILTTWKGGI